MKTLQLFIVIVAFLHSCFIATAEENHGKEHKVLKTLYTFDDAKLPAGFKVNNGHPSFENQAGESTALRILLNSKDNKFAGLTIAPETAFDWSEYSDFSLAFDLGNQGGISTQINLNISDGQGGSYSRSVSIPVGPPQTFYAKMDGHDLNLGQPVEGIEHGHNFASGLRSNPATWDGFKDTTFVNMWGQKNLKLDSITKISLSVQNALRDKQFTISNIRLIANPQQNNEFLKGLVDQWGQNAKIDFDGKVHSEEELLALRDAELSELNDGEMMADRSKFSGWTNGEKLKATGYFRAEKIGDQWSLVTPDGYPYFSTGLDIIRLANSTTFTGFDFDQKHIIQRAPEDLTPEDSLGLMTAPPAAWPTRHLASQTRADMFNWLPKYEDKLGKHFGYRRQAHSGAMPRGETYSFYSANLERRYGEMGDHEEVWRKVTVDRMLNWGFTSFGNWVDPSYYQNDRLPYFANGWIIGHFKTVSGGGNFWHPMPDVFDPLFTERADATAKQIAAEVQGSPWCVGVFVDNEKSWGRSESNKSRLGIVINTLTRDGVDCPLKAEFTRKMKLKYGDIEKLNQAWNKKIASWEAFDKGFDSKITNGNCVNDYSDLLSGYAEKYFQIVHDSLEKYLPNHMYLGCRFANWGMPIEAVKASAKYVDVVSFNSYTDGLCQHTWKFLDKIDMPCIIGEFHFGATSDTGLFHPGLLHCSDQADRARAYKDYVHSVIDNPFFVGCHWFQYMDSPITGRALDGENYNVGFVRVTDVPYESMVDAAKELHRDLYKRRFGTDK